MASMLMDQGGVARAPRGLRIVHVDVSIGTIATAGDGGAAFALDKDGRHGFMLQRGCAVGLDSLMLIRYSLTPGGEHSCALDHKRPIGALHGSYTPRARVRHEESCPSTVGQVLGRPVVYVVTWRRLLGNGHATV